MRTLFSASAAGKPEVSSVVLDASAILALLNDEEGAEAVARSLPEASVSAVNLSEVAGKLFDLGMPERDVREAIDALGLEIHPFDREMAFEAGLLRRATSRQGLSLGDRACLALGKMLGRPVLTADRSWRAVRAGVRIRVIR